MSVRRAPRPRSPASIAGALALAACSGAQTRARSGVGAHDEALHAAPAVGTDAGVQPVTALEGLALETLRAQALAGDAATLALLGVALEPARGARELTGEAAADEGVANVQQVAVEGDTAVLLATTTCGNATLATLRWGEAQWRAGQHIALVAGMHPGRCGQTEARAEAVPLSSDARAELVVVFGSQDATGESVQGPFLSVYQLAGGGELNLLLDRTTFGGTNDTTGATTQGQYYVIEDVPAPRELFIAVRPGRLGPGGAPAQEIVRRRYALHGRHLELVQQTTEPVEP